MLILSTYFHNLSLLVSFRIYETSEDIPQLFRKFIIVSLIAETHLVKPMILCQLLFSSFIPDVNLIPLPPLKNIYVSYVFSC